MIMRSASFISMCPLSPGVFGVLLNGWLFATFVHSHLLTFKSHLLVLNLCVASLGRNLLGFPFAGSSAVARRYAIFITNLFIGSRNSIESCYLYYNSGLHFQMALWPSVLSTIRSYESILWCLSNDCVICHSFGEIFVSKTLQTWLVSY